MTRGNDRRNYRSYHIGPYDAIDPETPAHLNVKFAIYCQRHDGRAPVAFHPSQTESVHR